MRMRPAPIPAASPRLSGIPADHLALGIWGLPGGAATERDPKAQVESLPMSADRDLRPVLDSRRGALSLRAYSKSTRRRES